MGQTSLQPEAKSVTPTKKRSRVGLVLFIVAVFIVLVASGIVSLITYYSSPESQKTESPDDNADTAGSASTPIEEAYDAENAAKSKTTKTPASSGGTSNTPAAGTETPAPAEYTFLDFYIDLANTSIKGDARTTHRWTKSTVYAAGRPGEMLPIYNECLNYFVSDFNANSGGIRLVNDPNQPSVDIEFYMVTMEELHNLGGNYLPFVTPHTDANGNMTRAELYLPTDSDWSDAEKCWSLKHEMMHAVGFHGHSLGMTNSEMGKPIVMYYGGLMENDKRAIRMHYTSGIPLKSSSQQARDFFANHSY